MRPASAGRTVTSTASRTPDRAGASYRPRSPPVPAARATRRTPMNATNRRALPRRASPAHRRPVPDGRRDRDDADLPRRPRPPALRRLRPLDARRRRGGAPPLLRAVRRIARDARSSGSCSRRRRGGPTPDWAERLGHGPEQLAELNRRAVRLLEASARSTRPHDADRDLRLRRPARRRLRRRRGDERGGG